MSLNTNLTQLDYSQAINRCVDALNDALRIQLSDATGIAIELSAADGDSVSSLALLVEGSGSLDSVSSGQLVAPIDMSTSREVQLLVDVGAGLTGACTVSIEISPASSGSSWIPSGITLAVTGSTNLKSTKVSDIAKRARVVVSGANAITVGTATLTLLARS